MKWKELRVLGREGFQGPNRGKSKIVLGLGEDFGGFWKALKNYPNSIYIVIINKILKIY